MEIGILDIETTAVHIGSGIIVEVGLVGLDLTTGHKRKVFDSVVHERPVTREHVENAWIVTEGFMSVQEIQTSPQLKEVLPELQAAINSFELGVTAYNNAFDFGWLEASGVVFPRKLACPMKIMTNICKLEGPFEYAWKYPKVQEAWDHLFGTETEYIEKHRGYDDAFHEADIVMELYKSGKFSPNETI